MMFRCGLTLHLRFIFRETFQNVRDTTAKLKAMNKNMIALSKAGEATEVLELYVPVAYIGCFRPAVCGERKIGGACAREKKRCER